MPAETMYVSKFNKQIVEAVKKNETSAFSQLLSSSQAFTERFTDLKWNVLHLATYYGRQEMVKLIISNPQGSLLINSLDVNNDGPIQLAAYRKFMGIYLLMATNNAFLDQPNAAGEDAIDAIKDPVEKSKVLTELSKYQLSEGNAKRIQTELLKLEKKGLTEENRQPDEDENSGTLSQSHSIRKVSFAQTPQVKEIAPSKTEGQLVFEKVLNNKADFINNSSAFSGAASPRAQRSPLQTPTKRMVSSDISRADEFEISYPIEEYSPQDEITIVSIITPPAFFYPPKTTQYDNLSNTY